MLEHILPKTKTKEQTHVTSKVVKTTLLGMCTPPRYNGTSTTCILEDTNRVKRQITFTPANCEYNKYFSHTGIRVLVWLCDQYDDGTEYFRPRSSRGNIVTFSEDPSPCPSILSSPIKVKV